MPIPEGQKKRGGGLPRITLNEVSNIASDDNLEILAVHDALKGLERLMNEKARLSNCDFSAASVWKRPQRYWEYRLLLSIGSGAWQEYGFITRSVEKATYSLGLSVHYLMVVTC
jgi:hypothetical protein